MRCTDCGKDNFSEVLLPEYRSEALGIPVILKDAVREFTCTHCGAKRLRLPRAEALGKMLAMVRVHIPVGLTGAELRFLRKTLNMTQKEFSEQIIPGADTSTLSRWENDTQGMGGFSEMVIRQNTAAVLADQIEGVKYDPKFTVGMKIYSGDAPEISLRRIIVRRGHGSFESWAEAA